MAKKPKEDPATAPPAPAAAPAPAGPEPTDQATDGQDDGDDTDDLGDDPDGDEQDEPAQPPVAAPAPKGPKAGQPGPARAEKAQPNTVTKDELVPQPQGIDTTDAAMDLLLKACEIYGVDPRRAARPKELASWRFYPGEPLDDIPDAVVIVTHGGKKLKVWDPSSQFQPPMDQDTEDTLRQLFKAYQLNRETREPIPVALPAVLTLPYEAVTGLVQQTSHRFPGGYLRRKVGK